MEPAHLLSKSQVIVLSPGEMTALKNDIETIKKTARIFKAFALLSAVIGLVAAVNSMSWLPGFFMTMSLPLLSGLIYKAAIKAFNSADTLWRGLEMGNQTKVMDFCKDVVKLELLNKDLR